MNDGGRLAEQTADLGLEGGDGTTLAVFVGGQVVGGKGRELGERVGGRSEAVTLQPALAARAQRAALVVGERVHRDGRPLRPKLVSVRAAAASTAPGRCALSSGSPPRDATSRRP